MDADGEARDAAAAVSVAEALAGAAHGATGVKATRDGHADAEDDEIAATWFGKASPRLEHRVALRVKVGTENNWEWIIFPGTPAQPQITRATDSDNRNHTGPTNWGKWTMADFDLTAAENVTNWTDDDNGDPYSVTESNLRDASHIRIDTRVDNGTATNPGWKKGTPAAIPPSG